MKTLAPGAAVLAALLCAASHAFAEERPLKITGDVKTLNFFTRSSGLRPEMIENPLALGERGENLFASDNRVRVKLRWQSQPGRGFVGDAERFLSANVEYDHRLRAGSYVGEGDDRVSQSIAEARQAINLRHFFIDKDGFDYGHSFYRAYLSYRSERFDADLGRQQIPWGVGRFQNPTDVFNPFIFSQLDVDERDGVDALNVKTSIGDTRLNYVFTPRGRRLHPSRHMVRASRDIAGYEVGALGGTIAHDEAIGYDFAGNIRQAAFRGEFLYRMAEREKNSVNAVFNLDYNFANGVYALIEYYFNGRGKPRASGYELIRFIQGEIQSLGRHYLGLQLGYDFTPLLRGESNTFANLSDGSLFNRLELKYSIRDDLVFTLAGILLLGERNDEFNSNGNLYYGELQYYF